MSRDVVDDLLGKVDAFPEIVEHFRHTYLRTDSFFHTLMLCDHEERNAGSNLHYLRFAPGSPHPGVLAEDDWDEFSTSGAFFARKFDAADAELLDRIDGQLLGLGRGVA